MNNNFVYALLLFCNFLFYLSDGCLAYSKNSAWISIISTSLLVCGALYLISLVLKKSKCTIDFNKSKIFNIILYFFTVSKISVFVALAIRGICRYFMLQSPENYILLILCFGLLFCLFSRKNTIVTACGFMGIAVMVTGIFISLAAAKSFQSNRIFPLLGEGNIKSFISVPFIFNLANLLYFYRDNQKRVPVKPIAYASVFALFLVLGIILTKPYELLGSGNDISAYRLSSLASLGIVFQRSEVLILCAWVFSVLGACGYLLFEASHTFRCALDLKDAKGLSGIHLIIVYALAELFLKFDLIKIYKAYAAAFFIFALICGITYVFIKILYYKGVKSNAA